MQNSRTTAGETAKPTSPIILVIFRDCHARHNLVVTANNEREERTYRRMATKQGYLVAVRKPRQPEPVMPGSAPSPRAWRKSSAIDARPRPQLGGAFNLTLTQLSKKGGEQ